MQSIISLSFVNLSPVNLIQAANLAIALLGIILISAQSRTSSLRILLTLEALLLVLNLLEETGVTRDIYLLTPVFTLAFGPALYWFCRQLVCGDAPSNRQKILHFLPLVLALPFTAWPQAIIALGSISQLIYLLLSIHLVNRYHQVTADVCSNAQELSVTWVARILVIFLIMMLQDLVRLNLQPYASINLLNIWYFISTTIYCALTAYLVVTAVRSPQVFEQFKQFEFLSQNLPENSIDADPTAMSVFQEIDTTIRTHELYKQPRLSLRDLSSITGLHEKNLSWAINQGAQKNFSEYINQLRVNAACEYLTSKQPNSLLDTAFAVGFSSKSTFNIAFKKQTGLTPSQFCKKITLEHELSGSES